MLSRLLKLGVRVKTPPQGTFYVWGSVEDLPASMNDCFSFFQSAIEEKVLCVPGAFFDVNPGKRRTQQFSLFSRHVRFSFGPARETLTLGRPSTHPGMVRWRSSYCPCPRSS